MQRQSSWTSIEQVSEHKTFQQPGRSSVPEELFQTGEEYSPVQD